MTFALFPTGLQAALAICALGLAWRAVVGLRTRVGVESGDAKPSRRAAALLQVVAAALLSRSAPRVAGAFVLDAVLLRRLFRQSRLRWVAHQLIVAGFTLLLLHALAPVVTTRLFAGYQPTLLPWILLRDLGGAAACIGVGLLLVARWRAREPRMQRAASFFLALLTLVLASGFVLQAHKIASPHAFERMTAQFASAASPDDRDSLRALWAAEYGVAFDRTMPIDAARVARGRVVHEEACASCHVRPASAFVSHPLSRLLAPLARSDGEGRGESILAFVHVFACLLGLASLPFTRFFHVVASPASLLLDVVTRQSHTSAPIRASRRALALDACVQCGLCDPRCSVAPLARWLRNPALLPSRKLAATRVLATGGPPPRGDADALRAAEGAFLCTDCGRCTRACPVGIDLADLWNAGRRQWAASGFPPPAHRIGARTALAGSDLLDQSRLSDRAAVADASSAPLSADHRTFSRCVQCQTCTNVCPVVAEGIRSGDGVDLTPQRVMNLLRLGLRDLALGSRMVRDCATCYQCQESCPEGIRVTDILCELRALSMQRLADVSDPREPA